MGGAQPWRRHVGELSAVVAASGGTICWHRLIAPGRFRLGTAYRFGLNERESLDVDRTNPIDCARLKSWPLVWDPSATIQYRFR